jgi:hypothetical protein
MCIVGAPGGHLITRPRPARPCSMTTLILKFFQETGGHDLIEYALQQLNSKFSSIGNSITTAS